ncbi:MAG: TrmH family RNA methyltransferase [bacterium]
MNKKVKKIVVLDNIRSVFNVGSIFRTSDALGVDKIYLCGCTPTPKDRFGRDRNDLAKVALGAQNNIEWEYCQTTEEVIKILKKEKVQIIALEQAENSVDYKKIKIKCSTAIVLGEEVSGLSKEVLKLADIVAEIPMKGKKESLNVSVAFGVAGYNFWGEYCTTRVFPFSNRSAQEN